MGGLLGGRYSHHLFGLGVTLLVGKHARFLMLVPGMNSLAFGFRVDTSTLTTAHCLSAPILDEITVGVDSTEVSLRLVLKGKNEIIHPDVCKELKARETSINSRPSLKGGLGQSAG